MKKLILFITVACFLCLSGCQTAEPIVTTVTQSDSFNYAKWKEYSDLELMQLTMESEQIDFRQFSAVYMTAEEWQDYMLDNCEPFRALMHRETALESIKEHTLAVADQYKDEFGGLPSENFVLLVMTVHPEMKEQLKDYEITFPPRTETEETLVLEIPKK